MIVTLTIPGRPRGKGRPRFDPRSGRAYTDAADRTAEARVLSAWRAVGEPDLGDGPLRVDIEIVVCRPGSHFRVGGDLSKAGLRAPRPMRTPDIDNVWKLVCDGLNQHAYRDDRQIVEGAARRRWAMPGERDHVRVELAVIRDAACNVCGGPFASAPDGVVPLLRCDGCGREVPESAMRRAA